MDVRGLTPGQREQDWNEAEQPGQGFPSCLPKPTVVFEWLTKNAWNGEESVGRATMPGCGREQGGLGLGDCIVAAEPPGDAEEMAGH